MEGDTFPKRVASSLIESFTTGSSSSSKEASGGSKEASGDDLTRSSFSGDDLTRSSLIHYSCKDFESYISRLSKFEKKGSRNAVLSLIRRRITTKIANKVGIFSTSNSAKKLIYGLQGLLEGKFVDGNEQNLNKYYYFNKNGNQNDAALSRYNESSVNSFHIIVN